MGKAYTSDERSDIRVRIMEAALEHYHDNGSKTLNIREIAKKAGISPGGFYNFWPDKDSLILDVMKYRASQKLDLIRPLFKGSEKDPIGFLSSQICFWCADMKGKLDTKPIYRESMDFLQGVSEEKGSRFLSLYSDFFNDLKEYWLKAGAVEAMDIEGVTNLIISVSILLSNSEKIDNKYFQELISSFTVAGLSEYINQKDNPPPSGGGRSFSQVPGSSPVPAGSRSDLIYNEQIVKKFARLTKVKEHSYI